jgi:hypothetical protein
LHIFLRWYGANFKLINNLMQAETAVADHSTSTLMTLRQESPIGIRLYELRDHGMADRGSIAFVRSYIEEQSAADPLVGLEVRRCILSFVKDHKHPAAALLLQQIEALDRALVEGSTMGLVAERRLVALDALSQFEDALTAEKVVSLASRSRDN